MELSSTPLFVAALAVLALGVLVARVSDGRAMHRWVTALLALEGVSLLALGLVSLEHPFLAAQRNNLATGAITFAGSPWWTVAGYFARDIAVLSLSFVYLMVLSFLATPLASWLRSTWAKVLVALLLLATAVQPFHTMWIELRGGPTSNSGNLYVVGALVGIFALLCSLHALARAPKGSAVRRRAAAFALAFGVHDVTTIAGFAIYAASDGGQTWIFPYYPLVVGVGTVAFVALLAYGFLRAQLFDIDLRIKIGIRRGTLAAIFVVVILIAFEVAQQYLNRVFGVVAGGAAAGVLVFASPRLNKFADKVSDTAMPKVQPTTEYLAYKKLEVYRAAVEGALLDGKIDQNERAVLDRLRAKLAIGEPDAAAMEAEVAAG